MGQRVHGFFVLGTELYEILRSFEASILENEIIVSIWKDSEEWKNSAELWKLEAAAKAGRNALKLFKSKAEKSATFSVRTETSVEKIEARR